MNDTERIKNELEHAPYAQKIRMLLELCSKYKHKSDDDFLHYGQLLLLNLRSKDITPEICDTCNAISEILHRKSNHIKALTYSKNALEYSEKIGYPDGLIQAYSKISNIQTVLSNYHEALDAAFNALRINEHLDNKKGIATSFNNIGIIYSHISNFESALEYFLKSLELKQEYDDQQEITSTYQNLSLIYMQLGELDKAVNYGEKVLDYNLLHHNQVGISFAYNNLGALYLENGNIHQAIDYLNKSLVIKELTADKLSISNALQGIGECYSKLKNYEKAVSYYERALKLAEEIESKETISNLSLKLAYCFEQLQDFEEAYKYQKLYSKANDEINSMENQKQIAEFHAKYEIEKKDKENEVYRLKNVELAQANATKNKFFSIISHDLRSPIAIIQSYINLIQQNIDDYDKNMILEMTEDLDKSVKSTSLLLQNLLTWSKLNTNEIKYNQRKINLSDVINEIISTLSINIKQKQLSAENWISDNLMIDTDEDMVKTILRNLLNNAIKYSNKHGKIIFSANEKDDSIEISVKDSGVGIHRNNISKLFEIGSKKSVRGTANEKGSGLGLILCREFAELCGGTIFVESVENKGSIFTLMIPKEKVGKK
jgi:signal transduction histidine kinase